MLSHDHRTVLRELRRFDAEETLRFERRSLSLVAAKYLLLLDRSPDLDVIEARTALDSVIAGLLSGIRESHGARRCVVNLVEVGGCPTGTGLALHRRGRPD